jgi:TolB-like protein
MNKIIFSLIFMFIGSLVFSQERIAIAVFPFEDMDKVFTGNESVFFYRRFSNEFVNKNNGRFKVIPRQDVEKLINTEASFQLSDFSSKEKTAEMQKVLNGAQILSGYIGKMGNKIAISISLFTYPDLEQLPGGVDFDVADVNELFNKIPELVQNMQNLIADLNKNIKYKIGDRGPGGGFIFFAENGVYMECSMDIGSYTWDQAVSAAKNYKGGGFTDWHLPSRGELELMYKNLKQKGLGGFSESRYWSSNQSSDKLAWYFSFINNSQGSVEKIATYSVRAVRTF